FFRCALMPRSLSASVTRRARFSSMSAQLPRRSHAPIAPGRTRLRSREPGGATTARSVPWSSLYNSGATEEEGTAFELGTDGPKVILAGIDDSVTSLRAGAYAARLARRQGARLVCVYVEQLSAMSGAAASTGAGAIAAQQEALRESSADLRQRAEEYARAMGISLT